MQRGRGGAVRARAAVATVAAALVVLLAASFGVASPVPGQALGGARDSVLAAKDGAGIERRGRPFEHRRHESLSCRTCHGTGAEHRKLLIRSPRDCAGCHHDERRAQACGDCHRSAQLSPARDVVATLSLGVWDSARTRALPFSHDIHTRAGSQLSCKDCHATPVTLARNRECASCHEQHHRPEATCATCHANAKPDAHKAAVHLSCSGSGCHAANVAPPPNLSRSLCVTCHAQQKDHEPQGTCAACHGIPGATLPQRGAWANDSLRLELER